MARRRLLVAEWAGIATAGVLYIAGALWLVDWLAADPLRWLTVMGLALGVMALWVVAGLLTALLVR